jgi:pseudouridine-5'-phosphate glycosidase
VIGYATDRFPAFWTRESALPAPIRLDRPESIAAFIGVKRELGLSGGVLVANPVPHENAIGGEFMERHIARALRDAAEQGVTGKAVTPYLLSRLFELTEGRSLSTNIALVKNNAALAARIAAAL